MKNIFFIVSIFVFLANSALAKDLEFKVHRAGEDGFNLASVLITGEKEAVLIDTHFKKSDAYRVVAQILESKKELKTIYVSHGDPDYYFGLTVLKEVFPKAEVYASEETVKHIKKTYMKKLDFWGPKLGVNGDNYIILPKVLKGDTLKLEDKEIKIMGLKSQSPDRTYVYVPSIKAIFGGVNIDANEHLWMADSPTLKDRNKWIKVLENMKKLEIKSVIPAHVGKGAKNDISLIDFSLEYLKTYNKADKMTKNSKELIQIMQEKYPKLDKNSSTLSLGAQVSKGEIQW